MNLLPSSWTCALPSRVRWYGLGGVLLLLLLTGLSVFHYEQSKVQLLSAIDQQLYAGATALRHMVGDAFHDRVLTPDTPPPQNYQQQSLLITRLCRDLRLKYLYTLVPVDDRLYFTLTSLNEEELRAGNFLNYMTWYEEAGPEDYGALSDNVPRFFASEDRWGRFRSVLIPCTTTNGHRYLVGADLDMAAVESQLMATWHRSLIEYAVLALCVLPITGVFMWPLRRQLYHDELTGLPNRARLKLDLCGCRFPQLMLIDIDAFKDINSFYGVQVGDQLLIRVADYLRQVIPGGRGARLYRLSGDEYAILCESSPQSLSADYLIKQINDQRFEINGTQFRLSVTAGIAQGAEKVIEHADLALKEAKRVLKPYKFYSPYLYTAQHSRSNLLWTHKLKDAIDSQRLEAFFQPIHDNRYNGISHYEALIRLIEEDGTIVGPVCFMEAARHSRVYDQLTTFMIDEALLFIEKAQCACTVNLSSEDILVEESRQKIIDRIRRNEARKMLVFEIVESEGIENYEVIKSFIEQVQTYGVRIAVDDFGTGYSNFEHIAKLNVDYLKIDGSLIAQLDFSERARTIIEAIIHFARELGIQTIAEYVSSESLQKQVAAMGIDYSQGYYWGKPQPARTFTSPVQ